VNAKIERVSEMSVKRLKYLLDEACKRKGEAFRDGKFEMFQVYSAEAEALQLALSKAKKREASL